MYERSEALRVGSTAHDEEARVSHAPPIVASRKISIAMLTVRFKILGLAGGEP